MKKFVVYNGVGKILRFGQCPDKDIGLQSHVGQFVLEGVANDLKHKIVGDKIVDKLLEEK